MTLKDIIGIMKVNLALDPIPSLLGTLMSGYHKMFSFAMLLHQPLLPKEFLHQIMFSYD